jgi:hypothetical protein
MLQTPRYSLHHSWNVLDDKWMWFEMLIIVLGFIHGMSIQGEANDF